MSKVLSSTGWSYKPTGPLPAAIRASLINVIIDPSVGAEADVPKTRLNPKSISVSDISDKQSTIDLLPSTPGFDM